MGRIHGHGGEVEHFGIAHQCGLHGVNDNVGLIAGGVTGEVTVSKTAEKRHRGEKVKKEMGGRFVDEGKC